MSDPRTDALVRFVEAARKLADTVEECLKEDPDAPIALRRALRAFREADK